MELTWVCVSGGICRYGDEERPVVIPPLYWASTPLTVRQLDVLKDDLPGDHGPDVPVTRVTHDEAAALAARVGGRLPRSAEWEWMAAGPDRRRFPWGDGPWHPQLANLRDSGVGQPTPVAAYPDGVTPDGLYDVGGNVWEWTATPVMGEGHVIRGGSFASLPLYAQCTFLNAVPDELRSRGIGFRAVRDL